MDEENEELEDNENNENEGQKTSDDIGINSEKGQNYGKQFSQKASQVKDRAQQISKMAKKVSKKFNAGAAKVGKIVAQIASKLGPALPWVALVVVIIFIVVGICGFLATMPGLLTGKLKALAQGVADWWQMGYKTEADASVNKDDVIEAAEYVRSMGYDLIGYGFIPAKDLSNDTSEFSITEDGKLAKKDGSVLGSAGSYYDKYGICYTTGGNNDGADGTFETAGSITDFYEYNVDARKSMPDISRLRTYLLSDARMFHIRNYDDTETFASWLHDIFLDNDEDWSKGLISLYKAKDYIATEEYSKLEAGYIKIDPTSKEMEVKVGWNNNSMKFQMDGWSGRYGLTLEFLLSLHLGTMAPELVSTIARTFDTEVQVYLNEATQKVTGFYKDEGTPDYISAQTIKDHENPGGIDGWIGNEEAYTIMKELGLESQEDGKFRCTNAATMDIVYINGAEGNNGGDDFSKVMTTEHNGKKQNVFAFEGDDQIPGNSWKEFFDNYPSRYQSNSDGGDEYNSVEYMALYVNDTINYLKDNYGNWIVMSEDKKLDDINIWDWKFRREALEDTPEYDGYTILNWDFFAEELEKYVPFKEFATLKKPSIEEFDIITLRDTAEVTNDTKYVRLSIVIERTSGDSNCDVGVMAYTIPSINEQADPETCSESDGPKACPQCEKYVETIRDALKAITEDGSDLSGEFKTYNPFIARVVDSWFRDTFFVIPEDGVSDLAISNVYSDPAKKNNYGSGSGQIKLTGNDIEFVDVDNEYLEDTDEYWTKYETTTNSKGETVYVLYVLKNNGEIDKSQTYIRDFDSEGREVYKNVSTGVTELVENSDLKLVKKHVTTGKITDDWEENEAGNVWTVYSGKIEYGKSDYYELEVHSGSDSDIKEIARYTSADNYERYFYYQYTDREIIEQKEDARRGITNPTIKQMFKIRKYYIYDGTEERAQEIYDDWQDVLSAYGSTCLTHYESNAFFKEKYDQSSNKTERAVEMAIDDYYYYGTGPFSSSGDPRNSSLIGNIKINKDTLNAFSILENTHTLDADYQYRDFKELIVELDYFDKEDLSDKPDEVFEWIIPGYSEKWPIRSIDKSEEYYGTLIHSDKAITKIKADLGIEGPDPSAPTPPTGADTTEDEKTLEISKATGYTTGLDVISPVTGEVINYGTYKRDNTDFIDSHTDEDAGTKETAATLEQKGINVEEEVGFIQIKVLNKEAVKALEDVCGSNKISVEYEGSNENINEIDAWNGFYKEYEGVCEGYIITIEGIELLYNGADVLSQLISNASSIQAADIKAKTTPNLADNDQEEKNQKIENAKVKLDAAKVVGGKLYIREGAIIGKTTYSKETAFQDYSYIRLILRNEKLKLVENVEDYFDLPEFLAGSSRYAQQNGDDLLLANLMHHEGCAVAFEGAFGLNASDAEAASKVTGMICVNRAVCNYGNYGKTIREQILAPGQYATSYVTNMPAAVCDVCLENARWVLSHSCYELKNPSGEQMPANILGQSGWCWCTTGKYTCWWWIDTTHNGSPTEADAAGNPPYDTFYCQNTSYPE